MKISDIALAVLSTFILGVNFVAVKIGVAQFPPLFMMALRFTLVTLILIWFVKPPAGQWLQVLGLSVVLGTLHFGLFFMGIAGVDASVSAIVFQLGIPFGVIFAWIFLGERFGWRRATGIGIAFFGVVLIAGSPGQESSLFHILLVVASVVAWGLAAIQIKKLEGVSAMTLAAWMALMSAPQLMLISFFMEDGQWNSLVTASPVHWGALLFSVLAASIVGYGLWYHLIGRFDVSVILPFSLLNPVFAIVSAGLILGEEMTAVQTVGAALTLMGVAFVQWRARYKESPEP